MDKATYFIMRLSCLLIKLLVERASLKLTDLCEINLHSSSLKPHKPQATPGKLCKSDLQVPWGRGIPTSLVKWL